MIGGFLAGLAMWGAASAALAPPPLDAFFDKPAINGMRLSPSGRYLASIRKRGEGQAVVVLDRQTGVQQVVTFGGSDRVGFDWIEWKSDDRLLLRTWLFEVLRANDKPNGAITGYRYGRFVEAVDRDGKHLVVMFQNSPGAVQYSAPFLNFLDLLPADPSHVLVNAPDAEGFSSVWKVDVGTGEGELVAAGDISTVGWSVDGQGAVVGRTELHEGDLSFEAHDPAGGWSEVMRTRQVGTRGLADIEVLGPAPGAGQVYVAARPAGDGARSIRTFDFNARAWGPEQWPASAYDISSILYRPGSREMIGACYVADVFTCDFKDPLMQAQFQGVSHYFHGARNLQPVSMSADAGLWVMSATGADQPGAYYVFDAARKDVALAGERYPELPEAALGKGERYDFKARDGTDIPAYLTRPPGAPGGRPPMVVLVHDGPGERASFDYDALTQFLATRGYLVFQPNFRGSGGYGAAWARAGDRQWGGLMQDDVTDGVKALVAEGRADPARVCIIGGGYGGYAALQAGAGQAGLYRCVASWGGPSDLPAWLRWEKKSADEADYREHLRSIGDPAKDRVRLERASPISHAAAYRPAVLLVYGDQDDVVPVEQSKAMAAALTKAGKEVRLMALEGEGHADFGETGTRAMFTALADFLGRHIGPPPHS
jgi:dipeptidyl aminopeptidase/acylaminoacyl peptidase